MPFLSLKEIESEVNRLAKRIGAHGNMLPSYGESRDNGYPHIEVDGRGYHYVVVERGQELERRTTVDIDELLFWIFEGATSSLASQYEVAHRVQSQDTRRILFERQIELLASLSPAWGERERRHLDGVLKENPFDDHSLLRAIFSGLMMRKGHAPMEAQKMAYEKYPAPEESE